MSYHNISGAPEPFLAEVELQTITGCSELPRPHGQVFPVRREALMRYLSSGVTFRGPHGSFIQYIYSCIMIPVQYKAAERTLMYPYGQGFGCSFAATAANDARVSGGYSLKLATSFFRFVCQFLQKASPSCV